MTMFATPPQPGYIGPPGTPGYTPPQPPKAARRMQRRAQPRDPQRYSAVGPLASPGAAPGVGQVQYSVFGQTPQTAAQPPWGGQNLPWNQQQPPWPPWGGMNDTSWYGQMQQRPPYVLKGMQVAR